MFMPGRHFDTGYCKTWTLDSGLDWTGMDWTGLDWTGLDWNGLGVGLTTNCACVLYRCRHTRQRQANVDVTLVNAAKRQGKTAKGCVYVLGGLKWRRVTKRGFWIGGMT